MALIVFAETGLLVGFFSARGLPGRHGWIAGGDDRRDRQRLPVWESAFLTVASVLGNTAGYAIGAATGPKLFTSRENSMLFNKKHLYRAHAFYEKHGGRTIVLARFMPVVRTFVPVVAGMGRMDYARYTQFNVIGGVAWIWSMLFIGYFLGRYIPGVDKHIELVILVVILLSFLPGIISWWRHRGERITRRAGCRFQVNHSGETMPFTLPALPYPLDALEPHIDAKTMEIHHTKHHQAYVNKFLNAAIEKAPGAPGRKSTGRSDERRQHTSGGGQAAAIRNNGGGHWNHSMFWELMGPKKGGEPSGKLAGRD